MSKAKTTAARIMPKGLPAPPKGPYLSVAVIAEKILTEPDTVPTIVRIIDKTTFPSEPPVPKGDGLQLQNLSMLVAFRTGGRRANWNLHIIQEGPSGFRQPIGYSQLPFNGTQREGVNVQFPVVIKWEGAGLYWYDIFLNKKFVARIPLEVAISNTPDNAQESQS